MLKAGFSLDGVRNVGELFRVHETLNRILLREDAPLAFLVLVCPPY